MQHYDFCRISHGNLQAAFSQTHSHLRAISHTQSCLSYRWEKYFPPYFSHNAFPFSSDTLVADFFLANL